MAVCWTSRLANPLDPKLTLTVAMAYADYFVKPEFGFYAAHRYSTPAKAYGGYLLGENSSIGVGSEDSHLKIFLDAGLSTVTHCMRPQRLGTIRILMQLWMTSSHL